MQFDPSIKTALLLAPHPDDWEFGCGATLRRLSDSGVKVCYAAFSPCIESLPAGSSPDRLWGELHKAVRHLGIQQDGVFTYDFAVRYFPRDRQAILEALVQLKKKVQPDLVLMPNSLDLHQDHQVIYAEGLRAFKHTRMLGYELPWNNLNFRSDFHMRVQEQHLDAKVRGTPCKPGSRIHGWRNPLCQALYPQAAQCALGQFAGVSQRFAWTPQGEAV